MTPVTVDGTARNSFYSAGNIGWSARSAFAYRTPIQQLAGASSLTFGDASGTEKRAFSFTTSGAIDVTEIRTVLSKVLAPTDNVSLQIYSDSSNLPNASIATADNVYNGANLSTTASWVSWMFSTPVSLSASTKYWLVIQRSGAVDASNHYRQHYNNGGVLAGGGTSFWNGSVWSAETAANDWEFQILTETPSALYQLAQDTGGSPKLHMWKSTDAGANWTEQDAANAPSVNAGTSPFDGCDTRSGPYIGVAYFTATNTIRGREFNMATDAWNTTEWGSADATTAATQERGISVAIDNTFVTASIGAQAIFFTSSADDADLGYTRRTTSTWTATGTGTLAASSTEASLTAATVTDKAPIGHVHRFFYDVANDDFVMRSVMTGLGGTATALDSTAADVETEHASACYQIFQASGVDTIVAAYIDADGSIQERILTLEVTSASVSMASENAVGTATTSAGRQLATCSYEGTRYIVASVSGTGIDYYTQTSPGSWTGPTNWKTGLTSSSISNVLAIDGYGLLVTYTDNGDVKVDWIVAPATGDATGTVSTGSLSVSGQAITAQTGVVGTVDTGSLAISGQAISGTVATPATGTVATGTHAVSGQAVAATTGVVGAVATGSHTVAGQAVAAATGVVGAVATGSLAVAGQAVAGTEAVTGAVATGSHAVSGQAVTGATGTTATVATGSHTVAGQAISANPGVTGNVATGNHVVSGQTVQSTTGTVATVTTGSHAVAGQAVTAATGVTGNIATGSHTVTGNAVAATTGSTGLIGTGTHSVDGQAVLAEDGGNDETGAVVAGSLSVSGQAVSATYNTTGNVATGSLSVTGQAITASTGTSATVTTGSLDVTGRQIEAATGTSATVTTGSYSVSGQPVSSVWDSSGSILTGEFAVTGQTLTAAFGQVATIETGTLTIAGQTVTAIIATAAIPTTATFTRDDLRATLQPAAGPTISLVPSGIAARWEKR